VRTVTTENQRYLGDWLVRVLNFPLPENTQCIGQLQDGNLVAVVGYAISCQKPAKCTLAHWLKQTG